MRKEIEFIIPQIIEKSKGDFFFVETCPQLVIIIIFFLLIVTCEVILLIVIFILSIHIYSIHILFIISFFFFVKAIIASFFRKGNFTSKNDSFPSIHRCNYYTFIISFFSIVRSKLTMNINNFFMN